MKVAQISSRDSRRSKESKTSTSNSESESELESESEELSQKQIPRNRNPNYKDYNEHYSYSSESDPEVQSAKIVKQIKQKNIQSESKSDSFKEMDNNGNKKLYEKLTYKYKVQKQQKKLFLVQIQTQLEDEKNQEEFQKVRINEIVDQNSHVQKLEEQLNDLITQTDQIELDNERYKHMTYRIKKEDYITRERVNQLINANDNLQNKIQNLQEVYLSLVKSETGAKYKVHLYQTNNKRMINNHDKKKKDKEQQMQDNKISIQIEIMKKEQKNLLKKDLKNSIMMLKKRYEFLVQKQRNINELKIIQALQVSRMKQDWKKLNLLFSTTNPESVIAKYQQTMSQYQNLETQLNDYNEQLLNLQNKIAVIRKERDQQIEEYQQSEDKKYQYLSSAILEYQNKNQPEQFENLKDQKKKNIMIRQKIKQIRQIAVVTIQIFYLVQLVEKRDEKGILGPKINYEFKN